MTKVAIVTGGTRGIGYAISQVLIEEGYTVAAAYHTNEDAAQKYRDETKGKTYKFDVADYSACEEAVRKIESDLGPVSVLVNNAGITKDGTLHKMPLENWHGVIESNLTSCFNMSRAVINGMRERGYGRIINISSINGQKGQFGQTNYAAAKAGILGFTKALALESAAKGVTVNAVCPGYIETEMTAMIKPDILASIVAGIPIGRMGKPRDIAKMVAFLASDDAGFITGASFPVNGGQYMSS